MEIQKTEILNKTERANSFSGRYASVGSDFKIYFDTLEELKQGIQNVLEASSFLQRELDKRKEEDGGGMRT